MPRAKSKAASNQLYPDVPKHSRPTSHTPGFSRPIFTESPLALRHAPENPYAVPSDWQGTAPEYLVYRSLMSHGKAPGIDFSYQTSLLGGHQQIGGIVADFTVNEGPIALNVQGMEWHYGMGSQQIASDTVQRAEMESLGYTVVYIDEEDIYSDVDYFVSEALVGHDHSRSPH